MLLRTMLASRLKRWIAGLLCHPIVGRVIAALCRDRIPSRGLVVYTRHPLVSFPSRAALFWGLYEKAEINSIKRFLRPDLDVVELGSSIGVVTCHLRRHLDPERRIIAVEANPALIDQMRANVARNTDNHNILIINSAIAYGAQSVELALSPSNLMARVADKRPVQQNPEMIPAVTLSGLLRDHDMGDFTLVCDIEGAEAEIIVHDRDSFARCQQIIIELHANQQWTPDSLLATFTGDLPFALHYRRGSVCVLERKS